MAVIFGEGSPPDLLDVALTRARLGARPIPTIRPSSSAPSRVDIDAYPGTTPARGDIVAFTVAAYPDNIMLKRVIGLPGDTVEQVEGVVQVNGEPLERYVVHDTQTLGPWTVEPGHLFVMDDNRPNSNDSRFSLGQIASSDLIGEVLLDDAPRGEAPAPMPGTASRPSPSGTSTG